MGKIASSQFSLNMDNVFRSLSQTRRSRRLDAKKCFPHADGDLGRSVVFIQVLRTFLLRTGCLACRASGHLGLGSRLPRLLSMGFRIEKANCAISCHRTMEIGLQLICQLFRRSLGNCQVLVADLGLNQSFMAAVPDRML